MLSSAIMTPSTKPADECPCPICGRPARLLESVSEASFYIDYYRCPVCVHVFTAPKEECEPTDDVTVRR